MTDVSSLSVPYSYTSACLPSSTSTSLSRSLAVNYLNRMHLLSAPLLPQPQRLRRIRLRTHMSPPFINLLLQRLQHTAFLYTSPKPAFQLCRSAYIVIIPSPFLSLLSFFS